MVVVKMSQVHKNYDEIKRKIRKLKKLEMKIRYQSMNYQDSNHVILGNSKGIGLVWDEFFDLHKECAKKVKYPINRLALMNKDEIKDVISEYFYIVYYRFYKENGITDVHLYDPEILTQMGLPINADSSEIKKKFRELAKKYHPDTGGDSTKFIELMENYERLI